MMKLETSIESILLIISCGQNSKKKLSMSMVREFLAITLQFINYKRIIDIFSFDLVDHMNGCVVDSNIDNGNDFHKMIMITMNAFDTININKRSSASNVKYCLRCFCFVFFFFLKKNSISGKKEVI